MGKVYTSAELKSIQIVVPTVLVELRFGHMTRFSLDGMVCVVLVKCSASVPCATADEESGSNLKF